MKNNQKKLIQVFLSVLFCVLCLFIDINFFIVQDLQAKDTANYLKEFDNFISADDSNYYHNYYHKYNYNLLAQTSYRNSYYPQNIDHANYSLILSFNQTRSFNIICCDCGSIFFLYNSNLLQKAWVGSTLLSKANPAASHQTDHQTEFVSINSGDSDHINLEKNSHKDPKPVFWHDDLEEDHKEDSSSLFSQSQQNQPNYQSVIKQAVDEKGIDFIEHTIKNQSDLRKYKAVKNKLDIKTLEYIYQLEKKYFELSSDDLKGRLNAYSLGANYTLS